VPRRLWLGAGAALALLVLLAVLLRPGLEGVVQRQLEARTGALLGTPVHIDAVELNLHQGLGVVRGVHVANPPGFSAADAVQLASVSIEVDLLTAFSSPTVVRAVHLDGAQVLYELDAHNDSNLDAIRRAIEHARVPARRDAAAAQSPAPAPAVDAATPAGPIDGTGANTPSTVSPLPRRAPPQSDGDNGSGRRYIVSLLTLHDGTVRLDAHAAGGPQRSESLPGFELKGIGADRPDGATPRQILRAVATAVGRDVALSAAAAQLEKWLGKDVGSSVGDLLKKGGAGAIGHGLDGMLEKLLKR